MPNAATTQASSASETTGSPIPLSYGYAWATGKRHAYFMLEGTGSKYMDFHRVGIWLLGEGEWDGPSELWINDELTWKGTTTATPPSGFSGQSWVEALDGGQPLVFNFHSGSDAIIGSGFTASSSGPDQGTDVLWAQLPPAINRLHFSRVAYYAILRKQAIENQTNTSQGDPSQWTDVNPIGLWRGLRCRLFDDEGNQTGYAFTTNPAWHFVDVYLRRKLMPEYGLDATAGPDQITAAVQGRFDWGSIYESAQYFDEVLSNGRRRFQGSYSFAQQTTLQAIVEQMLLVCRSFQSEYAGRISLNCDKPRSSVFSCTREHILPGSFEANDQSIHVAANKYVAKFRDLLVPQAAQIASITNSVGGRPTVTTTTPHPFNAGDFLAIGGTGTVYDGEWKVYSVPDVVDPGTPSEVDPTTMVLESKGSNYPSSLGAVGSIGLLYSRFKERSPEFWHKNNMLARGAVGLGIPRLRNKVRQDLDFATCTYDQASRIARYERDRTLGADVSPYVTPPFIKLRMSMFAKDDSGNLACGIRPGDRFTLDDTASFTYAGDYEVLDPVTVTPPSVRAVSEEDSIAVEPDASTGEIELTLGPYNEAFMYDDSDSDQAGWPSVPGSDPGNDTSYTGIDLADGGTFVFFAGQQQSGTQFQLPSTGFPAGNLLAWTGPAGANVTYHSMRVIQLCEADAARNLSLIYNDDVGTLWGGDVNFAALTWLSSDTTTTVGAMTWLELTLLGGETILFGKGVIADGGSFALPAAYTSAQMFAVAYPHDTPTATTHNPRICGAYVDSSLGVHFQYTDYAGNFWSGNAQVLVFAWKNNGGTVVTETLGGNTHWCEITLTNGKKFGVGAAYGVADGGSVTLPAAFDNGAALQSIVGSSSWANNGGSYHTYGVLEAYLDSSRAVHVRFGSNAGTYPGWGDVFMLYSSASAAPPTLVSVSPSSATIALGAQQQFSAVVQNNADQSVSWSVDGIAGGNVTAGTIDSTGLYTAPNADGSHTITATSAADGTASGDSAVTVTTGSSGGGEGGGGWTVNGS